MSNLDGLFHSLDGVEGEDVGTSIPDVMVLVENTGNEQTRKLQRVRSLGNAERGVERMM